MKKSPTPLRSRIFPVLVVVVTGLMMTAFTWLNEDDYYFRLNKGLDLFGQVYREISQSYVDEVDPEEFISAGIQGMLRTLDPYTVYMTRKQAADIDLLTSGSYGGIGITVGLRDSVVTIVDVMDGYSAQREGVRIGDEIFSINGAELLHGPLDTLREFTRGAPATTLQMTVIRHGSEQPMTFTLTRENIRVRAVSYSGMVGDGIGYIRLDKFSASAGQEVHEAIAELRRQTSLQGIVLDLRDNPGGLLESAVDVSSRFLPAGSTVVTTRGRDSSGGKVYRSTEPPMAGDVPLVVMVNSGSASAAEIVAGAIQDLDAGLIVGTRSFGKGLVQSVRRLSHEASLKITTARYYTPSGRSIQSTQYGKQAARQAALDHPQFRTRNGRTVLEGGGILPDTIVSGPDTTTVVERLRRSALFFKFATRYAASLRSLPEGFIVDERLLAEFEKFVADNAMTYAPAGSSLAHVRELREQAVREKSGPAVLQQIDRLRAELVAHLRSEAVRAREQIRLELADEIIGRFGGQRQRIEASLDDDSQLQTAVALLHAGRGDYKRLLSVR